MKKIVLISCVSKKRPVKSKARDLYISPLFKKNLEYALKLKPDQIFILSAKYGLVSLDEEIEPYDLTLNTMSADEVKDWSKRVILDLTNQADLEEDLFIFLAGAKYRKYLVGHLTHFEVPFEGLPSENNFSSLLYEGITSMIDNAKLAKINEGLLAFGPTVGYDSLFPTVIPEAAPLIATDPYAFLIAVCLDRGTKAQVIWTIPYDMKMKLGHLDPQLIYCMSLDELAGLFKELPRRPRYVNDAPQTIHDLTRIVVEECSGDASLIWEGRRAADVNRILRSIHGVGPGIANMGVLLIEKAFDVRFSDLDRTRNGY